MSISLFFFRSDIGNTWLVLDKVTAYKLFIFKLRMIIYLGMCQADILLSTRTLCLFWTSEGQTISHPIHFILFFFICVVPDVKKGSSQKTTQKLL